MRGGTHGAVFFQETPDFFTSNTFLKIFFKGNDNVGYIPDAYFQPLTLLLVSW